MTNTDRRYGVSDALAWKAPVRAATLGSVALSGEQTIDGVALVEGDRVLVRQQATASENGIYVVSSGNWRRAADADGPRDLTMGTSVVVTGGGSFAWSAFQLVTAGEITIDTTALTFQAMSVAVTANFRATSASSLAISVGTKTFTVEANRAFTAGDHVIAKSAADPGNFMVGQVASYAGTTLAVDVEATGGGGTHADWAIAIAGSPGATGAQGLQGPAGPAVSGIADVPGLAAALDAKLDDGAAGATGLNVLAATTQAAGRAAINAASDSDVLLLGRRATKLMNRLQPNMPQYHAAFVMGDGSITVCGQPQASLGMGSNTQAYLFPTRITLPGGLVGTPAEVIVTQGCMYILTDQGDVCTCGTNAEGELGVSDTSTRTVATLLDATYITPRSSGGASRAVTSIKPHGELGLASVALGVHFVCADGSLWACGYNNYGQGGYGHPTVQVDRPQRCLKIANSLAQAVAQGTSSSSGITPAAASRTFTVSAGKSWQAGQSIYGYSDAAIGNFWYGGVTSYSGTTLIVDIQLVGTPAAAADWIISEVVNDATAVYPSGGNVASVGYINTGGKALFCGRLAHGAHGLCSTGPGSGTASANFPVFRLPKTTADDAASQLPGNYVATRIVMGCTGNDASVIGILTSAKNLYMVGYNAHGQVGDGTTTNRANCQIVGSGTAAAAAMTGHVENAWCVGTNNPAFIAQLDGGAKYGWGSGAAHTLPSLGTGSVTTPTQLGAPFDTTGFKLTKVSLAASYSGGERNSCVALTDNNRAYHWGVYRNDGASIVSSSVPVQWPDPHGGLVAISDVKGGGYAAVVGLHVLYANGEVWGLSLNGFTLGDLGIGSSNAPSMPVRAQF